VPGVAAVLVPLDQLVEVPDLVLDGLQVAGPLDRLVADRVAHLGAGTLGLEVADQVRPDGLELLDLGRAEGHRSPTSACASGPARARRQAPPPRAAPRRPAPPGRARPRSSRAGAGPRARGPPPRWAASARPWPRP